MTAIATILALLPMALGLSKAGVFIVGPLAIVVIGGLTTSTILTLLLVPTLYVIVEDVRARFGRRRMTPPAPPTPPARWKDLESRSTDEQVQEPQEQHTPSFVEEQAETALPATSFVTDQTESAPNRSKVLLGLTVALLAQEAQLPEAVWRPCRPPSGNAIHGRGVRSRSAEP